MSNNSVKHIKYYERFYNPEFTAYDLLTLFSALLASQKEYSFDRNNLIEFISFCKNNSKFSKILEEVNLKSNGISYYSEEFDEAITKLKLGKILYTISPEQDSTICIFEDIPISELTNPKMAYVEETTSFIEEYKDFEKNYKNETHIKKMPDEPFNGIIVHSDSKRKYFTIKNNDIIYKRLKSELLITYLPYLGSGKDFGMGDICLEESKDNFKFYIIDRAAKFEYEEFDKIEDALQKLISYYKENELVDNPNKMEEIFYQTLGLSKQGNVDIKDPTKIFKSI